jgi:superfamily II DNA/RNA helicase
MLDMGFIPDIERIFKLTPAKKQTLFFSATMPPEITRLTKQFLHNPVRIEASRPATTAENIAQHLARIPASDPASKRAALRALIGRADVKNGIVFCNRKSEVDIVAKSLKSHGLDAAPIHGDLDQSTRTRTLEAFRRGELRLLVASDVAARGLDIPDVSHIFNFDVPHHADDYVHRIGRTGRAGRSGQAFMIVTPADARALDKVVKLTGVAPDEVTLDVDWAEVRREPRPERGGRPERGSRDRRRPGSSRNETPRHASSRATSARPESPAESEPVVADTDPVRPRNDRSARSPRSNREPPAPPAAEEANESRTVGFGRDLPAFLARPLPAINDD